jgi:hypothetical protein
VFDFGSERSSAALEKEGKMKKVTVHNIKSIIKEHPTGWIVYTDNDEKFITKEARKYIEDSYYKIDDSPLLRGNVSVYWWNNKQKNIE